MFWSGSRSEWHWRMSLHCNVHRREVHCLCRPSFSVINMFTASSNASLLRRALVLAGVVGGGLVAPALAQPTDPSGIDFVTIGAVNNPAYAGPDNNNTATGRGSINYLYNIGRTEVKTSEWMEFYNTFYGRAPIGEPFAWGAVQTGNPALPFRLNPSLPQAADLPVGGITWRTAARFCNWLHNNKSSDLSAIANGAYDTSTFGYVGPRFTDQFTRNPDARYWIPSLDERMKAVYYDPNQPNNGQNGWFTFGVNGTNTPPRYGPPGVGDANANFEDGAFSIPLGAYPHMVSPWGVLDAAGATTEWTETVRFSEGSAIARRFAGSDWTVGGITTDRIFSVGDTFPTDNRYIFGLRVAAAIPAPHAFVVLAAGLSVVRRRGRAYERVCGYESCTD